MVNSVNLAVVRFGRALVILVALFGATPARARNGARTARTLKPKVHRVEIGKARRQVEIGPRIKNLRSIRALEGHKGTIYAGLRRYRAVRYRIRELRARIGSLAKVTPLLKTGPFVLDRIDFRSKKPGRRPKVLIVGGVHSGSEPVGVEAALRFAEGLDANPAILDHFDITVVPLVNPSGLLRTPPTLSKAGSLGRYTTSGGDVNRSFIQGKWTPESRAMARMIKKERFDVVLDLHGAGTSRTGYFAIRSGDDGGMAARFMADLDKHAVLDAKGAGHTYALNAPGVVTSTNVGTLKQFAAAVGARLSYTFETPSRFTAREQVQGALSMVYSALRNIRDHGQLTRE